MTTASPESPLLEPGSYRDRDGRVLYSGDRVYRLLSARALADWEALRETSFFAELIDEGKVVRTERVDVVPPELAALEQGWAGLLHHERIPWVSYPYEWSFGMLKQAALLQLELMRRALAEGFVLKDASSYNVQWRGSEPIFIDVPSFQRLEEGEVWAGYLQFCNLFLYPLMLTAYKGVPFQPWLRGSLDGISPEDCARLFSKRDLFRPGVFADVYLQSRLQRAASDRDTSTREEVASSGFSATMIRRNVERLTRIVSGLEWKAGASTWSDYANDNSYESDDTETKNAFVRRALDTRRWSLAWDLGSNTGTYSKMAAESSDYVVAMDADHLAIERLFTELRATGGGAAANLLPLVSDLADPSPGLGWRWIERRPPVDRGLPEVVLFLALVHHIVIGANVPLDELVGWLAGLTEYLVIEWVDKDDPMVRRLLLNKEDLFAEYERDNFERLLAERFEVLERAELASGTRVLYFLRTRG